MFEIPKVKQIFEIKNESLEQLEIVADTLLTMTRCEHGEKCFRMGEWGCQHCFMKPSFLYSPRPAIETGSEIPPCYDDEHYSI